MRRFFTGLLGTGQAGEAVPQAEPSNSGWSSPTSPSNEPTRRGSLLRGRGKAKGNASADFIPTMILAAASALGDAIQGIISDTSKLSGDNLSGYETLLCILNDVSELDEPAEVVQARGMGCVQLLISNCDHPRFVELCNQKSLAAGLFQAMRLLRMLEIKQAKILAENPLLTSTACNTFDASFKVCKLLEKLCTQPATIEQIKVNLVKILTFPLCVLPLCGKHIQTHSAAVVQTICRTGFTSQQVWYLHDVQCITHLVRHLHELTSVASETTSSGAISPQHRLSVDSSFSASTFALTLTSTDYLLRGLQAEAEGMWLVALECVVSVISCTVSVGSVLVNDFESASGQKLLTNMLKNCSPDRFLHVLNTIMLLLFDPTKKEEEVQVLSSVASMLSEFLQDIVGVKQSIQPSDTVETLLEVCSQVIDSAELCTANGRIGLQQQEYIIQGMAYSLLTIYSNEPVACVRMEESYRFLPCLLISLPAMLHTEPMAAVLTTLNYVCQCIDSPAKMIITALSACSSVLIHRFIERNTLYKYNNQKNARVTSPFHVQQIELVFTSMEAICRTNKSYVVLFMKVNLFKSILTEPFEKMYQELHSHNQIYGYTEAEVNVGYQRVFERIIALVVDLNDKNSYAAEDIRRSGILLLIKKIMLNSKLSVAFIGSLLRLYEEIAKVDSVHLQEVVMILVELVKELNKDYIKITLIYNSLWRMLVHNEGFYKVFIRENCVEVGLYSLGIVENAFSTELSTHTDVDLVYVYKYITSILRFMSLILFFTIETQYHYNMYLVAYVTIGQGILSSGIFSHHNYKIPGLILCLQFITVFAYDQDIIYSRALDIFQPILPHLAPDILSFLIQKLSFYTRSDIVKRKRIGDIKLVPRFLNTLISSSKSDGSNLPSSFVSECIVGNWHSDSLFEIVRSCVKPIALLADNVSSAETFDADGNPLPLSILSSLDDENCQAPFEDAPYIGIPLYISAQNESGSVASLAMFFNESTVPMPTNAISISCWFRVDHDSSSPESISKSSYGRRPSASLNTMIPILSMESAGSDIHLNIEINPLTSDAIVTCTMRAGASHNERRNASFMEQEMLVFKPSFALSVDGEHWTHCVITMKRVKRFTSSNQVQLALFFNGLPWIPHSNLSNTANNYSPTGPSVNSNVSAQSSQNIGILNFDPLASSQNGEIRVGLPKDTENPAQSGGPTQRIVLQVANVSVYNEQLQMKQIATLFMMGPTYAKIHQSADSPLSESPCTLSTRVLTISNEMHRHALHYIDRLGLQGIEYVDETRPGLESHKEQTTDFEMPVLPVPIAMIHPLFTLPEHIAFQAFTHRPGLGSALGDSMLSAAEEDVVGEDILSTKARLLRYTLVNIADLENGIPLATLSSGGYISRSMSVGDCASSLGGPDLFLPLLLYAHSEDMLSAVLNIFRQHLLINSASLRYMQHTGYRIMAFILSHANKDILTLRILEQLLRFSVSASYTGLRISSESLLLVDQTALLQLICNHHVWGLQRFSMVSSILSFLKSLVCDEKYGALNALKLSSVGIVRWVLHSCLHVVQGAVTVSDPSIRIDTTADVWVYGSRSACEFADYRDETIPFLAMGMEVVMAVLGSEVRGKDIDLIISIILYTFVQTTTNGKDDPAASAGNDSDRPGIHEVNTGVGSEEIRKAQAEMWQSHPFCTYENIHNLSGSDNPLNSPSSQIRYIQPLEVYRVYLLRLLFKVYDDSLEEQRRPNRRPSNPRSSGNSSKDAANNTSNPNVSNAGAGGEFDICLLFRQIVPAHILLGVLEQSTDVASIAFTLRLLVYLIQKDPLFHKDFIGMKGYQILYTFVTQQVYIAIPVLLPLISLLFRIPIHLVMYPYQIKTAGKIIHLIDLEESVGPNTQDSALMEQTLPLLYIYYECIGHSIKYYMHHNLQTGNESEVYLTKYLSACESLVLSMMDHALDNSASFRYIYQHMFAIELHINTILTCSNAYSEYGSIIYDSATTGSSASSPGAHPDLSAFIQDNYLDSNQPSVREAAINLEEGNGEGSKQMDLSIHHPLGDRLIRQFEKIMFILLKEFDYSKLLYYIFTIYNAHTYTHSFFRGYQQLMMQCYTNVVSRSILENTSNNSLDYALLVAINKNITFLLPLLKGNLFYLENMFHLLFVQMELFKKHTVVFKNLLASNKNVNSQLNSQITLDMHQNLIRDMNSNLRCLIIFNLHNNPVSSPSFSAELRYKLLTFIKDNIDFIFYYVCEDQIDINILKYVNTNKGSVLNNEDKSINQFSSSNMQVLEALQNMAGSSSARYNNKMVLMNSLPILSSGQVQMLHHIPHTSNAAAGINTFKGERSKILNVFIIYILSYTYNLVLEEDTATRIQATRIIAYMANLRKYYIELLCSNNANITANMSSNTGANIALSPGKQTSGSSKMIKGSVLFTEESESNTFSLSYSSASSFGRAPSQSLTSSNSFSNPQSSGKSGVIDLYKDGICKLIPNSLGQYDLDLRSRLTTGAAEESESDLEDRFEESRFADFSYFISEYAYITDKLFAIFNNILTSVLPNTNQDSLDMQKVIKQQLHVFDLWSIIYQDLSSGSTIGNNVTSGGANAAGLASMTGNTLSISNQNPFNAQIYSSIQTFQHNLSTLNTLPGSPSKASQQNSHSLLASAESLQTAYLRLIILNKIGEKVMKMSLYWFREGIREIVAGGCNWKKVYHQCLSNPIWGHRIHSVYHNMQKNAHIYVHRDYQPVGSSSSPNPAVSYNRLYKSIYYHLAHYPSDLVIYKLDYVHGLEHTRRKIKRDFNNYANTFYYRVLQENIAAPQAEQEVQEDALATKKLFLPKKLKMKMNNSSTVQDEEVVDSAVMDDDEDAYDPTALLLEPATVEIDEDNSPSILESSIKIESHVDTNNSHTVKSNEDDLHMSKSSANANAPSISVGSGVVLATGNSEAQYKSLMIKEILRGIISNSNELKKCSFYNIERIYGLETQKALLIVGANYIHVISNFRVVHANASTISTAAAIQKPFAETAFEYTPSKKMPTNKASGGTGNMSSNSAMDEKYIQLNNIHNENIPAMQSSNYASYNNTIKDLYSNSNSQLHQQKEWMEDLWIEMLEMETFYDKIKIDEIHSFFRRRNQLKNTGLEISDVHGLAVLFACETTGACDEILATLVEHELPHSVFSKMLGLKNIQLLRGANNIYGRLLSMFVHKITLLWQNNSISNFEYLYYINAAAGRSYLDLTQYPVFPWIIADYNSEELDIMDKQSFRDLSLPMGCIGPKRKQQYVDRYQMMLELYNNQDEDEQTSVENIPFYYGTHYSCAGYVLHYLIRLQPFTNMSIHLQDGHLDKADRMFYNIKAAYQSAAYENLQDVRELIPEFFYLPHFLMNVNNIHFGSTQKGEVVNHVVLPPWAKDNVYYFIYKHRQALECKHVSESLHQWVDLIFGYKARGKNAIANINAFMHITYEDEIDVESIEDQVLQQAIISQINNFGICPKQLFTKAHVKKMIPDVVKSMNTGDSSMILVEPVALNWHQNMSPPLCVIGAAQFTVLARVGLQQATYVNNQKGEGVGDIKLISRDKIVVTPRRTVFLSAKRIIKHHALPLGLVIQNVSFIGSRALETEKDISYHEPLHTKALTAVAVDKYGKMIVSGSEDGSVRVWHVHAVNQQRKLNLLACLVAHHTSITCLDVNNEMNVIVSGSSGGYVCIWDSLQFALLYKISGFMGPVVSVSCNAVAGYILVATADELRLYSVSGDLLSYEYFDIYNEDKSVSGKTLTAGVGLAGKLNVSRDVSGACTTMTAVPCGDWQDGVVAVTGHQDGSVHLWKLDSKLIEVPYPDVPQAARSNSQETCTIRRLYIACTPERAHRSEITCLRLCSTAASTTASSKSKDAICRAFGDSRNLDLLVGDQDGTVSRWTSLRLDQLSQPDLYSLLTTAAR